MPSRRQIREVVVQFLYCSDLEGGADPVALREPFWEFVTESDRRRLQISVFRTVHHLAHGRQGRLEEFATRLPAAEQHLAAWPEAEPLRLELRRIHELESSWSTSFAALERLPKDDDDASVARNFGAALDSFFRIDRDLAASRRRFIETLGDFPTLRGPLEAVTASIRRLQRVSDRLRMVEEPENFPDQTDLARLRETRSEIRELRDQADKLIDSILSSKEETDATLASVVDNFAPERIDPVDRAILRLATYEIIRAGTPPKVVINEAIELAKKFGTTDSRRFVNGVLDRIARSTAGNSENPQVL